MPLYTRSPAEPLASIYALVEQQQMPDPDLQAAADAFFEQQRCVGSSSGSSGCGTMVPPGSGCVWLMQGEAALVTFPPEQQPAAAVGETAGPAPIEYVGSTDATTCVIAALRCPVTRQLWCAHLDHLPDADHAAQIRSLVCGSMRQPQLYLVGGYRDDPRLEGPHLAQALLTMLHGMPAAIRLSLCCVGAANTDAGGAPRSRQLAVEAATGAARPLLFAAAERGPEVVRRFAAQHVR
jgi:hypothetical protein